MTRTPTILTPLRSHTNRTANRSVRSPVAATGTDTSRYGHEPRAGTYSITTQITTGGRTVTSFGDGVRRYPPASSGPVFNLSGDGSSGVQNYVGTAANHCTINGNGFQIRSAANLPER
jgi:exo-beta-1,3-glucanase (GH17 family)